MSDRDTPRWEWDTRTKRFRDRETGRFLGARRVHTLRDEYVDHRSGQMRGFVAESVDGVDRTDATAWRGAVRRVETLGWRRIENTLITEYVYGRGGINAMTDADRDRLRNLLREQKTYWNGFMREAYADPDKMTTAYMQNRATYYHRSSTGFFERAKARAWDVALPEYPGEQECKANCFVGSTPVEASAIERSMRRWYEGRMVHVRTSSGHEFTVTPNHPIAGDRGWIAAGELREGDYLLQAMSVERAGIGGPDVEHRVTTIEQVHDALAERGNTLRVPGLVMNFHGEVPDHDVDVIPADRALGFVAQTSRVQRIADDLLPDADSLGLVKPFASGTAGEIAVASVHASHGIMSRSDESGSLIGGETRHANVGSFGSVALGNTSFLEPGDNRCTRDGKATGDREHAFTGSVKSNCLIDTAFNTARERIAGSITSDTPASTESGIGNTDGSSDGAYRLASPVTLDRVVEVEIRDFSGHVYNLQTDTGWYLADSIIAHNCRCRWSIEEVPADEEIHAYWIRSAGDSCTGCVANEGTYNPYIIPRVAETGVFT